MKIWQKWISKRNRLNRDLKKKVIYLHLAVTKTHSQTLTHVSVWQKPLQYYKVNSLQSN